MSLSVGIVGLANVGKSTLFNALLGRQQALVANYPFATIEPNVGVVAVEDQRLEVLAQIVETQKQVPAVVEFVDIAGLVAGAAKGEGLGNKFLSHIRQVDLICLVVRMFERGEIVRSGSVEPVSDYKTVMTELTLRDLQSVEEQLKKTRKEGRLKEAFLVRLIDWLNADKPAFAFEMTSESERDWLKELFLLTDKRVVVVANCDEDQLANREKIEIELAKKLSLEVVCISAKLEEELSGLGKKDAQEYLTSLGVESSGLSRLIGLVYKRLGLISFLTAGKKEVRAWTVAEGLKAPRAAGVIHSDFEKKFIKAKVCDYEDFVKFGGWKKVAESGKLRLEGKDYVVKEGDVIEFMIGV